MPLIQFQFRRGTAAEWADANPVLAEGEMGLELDTERFKIGDGAQGWNDLEYGTGAINNAALNAAIEDNPTATRASLELTSAKAKTDFLTVTQPVDLDAAESKLAGIEANATADQSGAEIKSLYEAQDNTNAFTDADAAKLDGIATGANNYSLPVASTTVIGGLKRNTGTAGQFITGFDTDGAAQYGTPTAGYRPGLNYLINGDFIIAQRGDTISAPNDDTYLFDRWYGLGDGNGVFDAIRPNMTIGSFIGILARLEINTAAKKFGIAQIIEMERSTSLRGKEVTLSFLAAISAGGPSNVKAAILSWDSPADAPTSDFISAWNASGTNPALIAGWRMDSAPVNLALTTTMEQYQVTATINEADCSNVAVFLWVDSTDGVANDNLYIADVQLEIGDSATAFQRLPAGRVLADCQRYYEIIRYNPSGQAAVSGLYSGTIGTHTWYYKATKRSTPAVALVTGAWGGGTPTIVAGREHAYFVRAAGEFVASGVSGLVALEASAEL
jgi:hypothetical protein